MISGRAKFASFMSAALLALAVAGCGSGSSLDFDACGNGVIDGGEECDDGPGAAHGSDDDGCLSTCKLARCGDGFVNRGVEECDTNTLDRCGQSGFCKCSDLGYEDGHLRCAPGCTYDISSCGPPLPTATATPPATATPTSTQTPTPLAGECGNGEIEADETCDDHNTDDNDECPSDCRIQPCTPTTTRVMATDVFAPPGGSAPRTVTILLSYPDGVVGLPEGGERARITAKGGIALTLERDFDHALRVRLNRGPGVQAGDVFSVSFDACQGAAPPLATDFSCEVLACDGVEGCSCGVALR